MNTGLQLRVSQHLALTPQLQQSIRLLQLSSVEIAQEVAQMLADNPLLEVDSDDSGVQAAFETSPIAAHEGGQNAINSEAADADWVRSEAENYHEDYTPTDWEGDGSLDSAQGDDIWGSAAFSAGHDASAEAEEADWVQRASSAQTLAQHLHLQAVALRLAPPERGALYFLIGSLDERGYLTDTLPELVQALCPAHDEAQQQECAQHLALALALLQSMDPVGVGARNLCECLQLQLQARRRAVQDAQEAGVLDLAQRLCAQPLEWLARRDTKRLAHACSASEKAVRDALQRITRLEPHPARCFVDVQQYAIVPDVIVQKRGHGLSVHINPEVMPRLRVHEVYANALRGQRASAGHAGLQQRLQEARWFIKNLQQRFDTLLRVSEVIVRQQKNFFVHGPLAMRPLVLREIAQELALHESTISRATTAKYMATPQGTYELKFFFGSGLQTQTGGSASSTAVRALIGQLIAAENPGKPLSDQKIADLLQEQGIECARRTVAKYRESLKIAPASLRKG